MCVIQSVIPGDNLTYLLLAIGPSFCMVIRQGQPSGNSKAAADKTLAEDDHLNSPGQMLLGQTQLAMYPESFEVLSEADAFVMCGGLKLQDKIHTLCIQPHHNSGGVSATKAQLLQDLCLPG